MTRVKELVRQAAFGVTRTPEEIRDIEATISGRPPAAGLGEKAVPNDLLQGGGLDQELVRQALFGYARNQRGERVPLDNAHLVELVRREASAIFAQGAASCSSCCKVDSCNIAIPHR